MVAALQELPAAVLERHGVSAVPADVDETMQRALGIASDDHRYTPGGADDVVARRGELGLGQSSVQLRAKIR